MANTVNPDTDKKMAADSTNDMPHTHDHNKLAADDTMLADQYKHIPGWGMDADEHDPAYPMRHYNGADHQRINYEKPPQQPVKVEILHSIERPTVSRVISDRLPPRGLSGAIRRKAFQFSEANAMHWMGLILADRVNMVEGLIDDLRHGHIPNIIEERGLKAEWKHNRKGVIKEALIGAAIITAAIAFSASKNKKKKAIKAMRIMKAKVTS